MSARRFQYHITYDARSEWWVCKFGGALVARAVKRDALVRTEAVMLEVYARDHGQHSEMVIHTKRGTIVKGPSGRRTYGGDPSRSRG